LSQYYPVWTSDIKTLADALVMIRAIGKICGKDDVAIDLVRTIEAEFKSFDLGLNKKSAAYFIWKSPWMTVGHDTFIHDMMQHAGYENVFSDMMRYPEVQLAELKNRNPQFVFLSSEPFPFKEKHIELIKDYLPSAA